MLIFTLIRPDRVYGTGVIDPLPQNFQPVANYQRIAQQFVNYNQPFVDSPLRHMTKEQQQAVLNRRAVPAAAGTRMVLTPAAAPSVPARVTLPQVARPIVPAIAAIKRPAVTLPTVKRPVFALPTARPGVTVRAQAATPVVAVIKQAAPTIAARSEAMRAIPSAGMQATITSAAQRTSIVAVATPAKMPNAGTQIVKQFNATLPAAVRAMAVSRPR
jgi:hypothetical protein